MYMPGVGQRQGQKPTWDRLRDALNTGRQYSTLTHDHEQVTKQALLDQRWSLLIPSGPFSSLLILSGPF